MKSFIINKNDANQRLDKFIQKSVPLLPKTLMYKYIRLKRIKINGKKGDISLRLNEGDKVDMYINDEFFEKPKCNMDFLKAPLDLNIIYEDENIILCDKEVGLLCIPNNEEYYDTLVNRVKHYLYKKGEYSPQDELSFSPALVNRIDRNTGGIVIGAKNAEALRILNQKMKDRELHKYYLAVAKGKMPKDSDTLTGFITKDEVKNKVTVSKGQNSKSKEIRTKYKVLNYNGKNSLVEVELLTGRSHQIRAHFASIGHPLIGDVKYNGTQSDTYNMQLLYSYKLKFDFKTDAKSLNYLNNQEFKTENVWFLKDFK